MCRDITVTGSDVLAMLRILTNLDMDSRLVLSRVIAGQSPCSRGSRATTRRPWLAESSMTRSLEALAALREAG